MDDMFMGEETGGKTLAILVAKDRSSSALMSTVVPRKTTGEFVSKRVVAIMKELGCEMSVGMMWRRCGRAEAPSGLSWRIVRHILPRVME